MTHASSNVLCVPVSLASPQFRIPSLKRVLVAHDLAPAGNDALRYALGLLSTGGAIRLLHVVPVPRSTLDPLLEPMLELPVKAEVDASEALARLEKIIAELSEHQGIQFSAESIVHSDAAEAICDAAEAFGADVVCMGARGHSRVGAAILGSVMQAVTGKGHRPVLAIPPPLT